MGKIQMVREFGIALVAIALTAVAHAVEQPAVSTGFSDWNQWRGPDRNGVAPAGPKLADAWEPEGPVLVWKSQEKIVGGPKKGGHFSNYGSPVVAKGRVYLYVHDQAASADLVYCLAANTGRMLWKKSCPGSPEGGGSCTPYVGGGKVYVVGTRGLYCLDAETGKEIWKVPGIARDEKGDGMNSSPALVAGVLVTMAGSGKHLNPGAADPSKESGVLKGFDPVTGKELWACPQATSDPHRTGDKSASVAVWNSGNGPRLITSTGKLTCVNPKDGRVIWQDKSDWMCVSPATPAIVGNVCVTCSRMKAFRLRPDKAEGLFKLAVGDRVGSYLLHDGHVFADCGGTYRCIDFTGKIRWQKTVEGGYGTSSPVLADGKIFHVVNFKDESKIKLTMFSATTNMPATFYEANVPALHYASPAICDGKLFIRLVDGVACYDLTKAPDTGAIATKGLAPGATSKPDALISFVDVSPSYHVMRKAIKDQVWPPENKVEAATLDWAVNKPLNAEGWINFIEVQDARGLATRDQVAYARVVLEAAAPGKLALSLSVIPPRGDVRGIWAWVNGTNVLRQEVAHPTEPVKNHEELVVNLVAGRNTLLFRTNTGAPQDWKLRVQAKPLGGLKVKQIASTTAGRK